MTHFVYVYIKSNWKELYYSIKSIEKYFTGDRYKIFVVGDSPGIKGVTHIPCVREKGRINAKVFDSIKKLKVITDHSKINDDFIYMYDDIMLLRSLTLNNFKVTISNGHIGENFDFSKFSYNPSPEWKSLFNRTIAKLVSEKKKTWNYETHLPRLFNKAKISKIIQHYRLEENAYLFNTLYFNNYTKAPFYDLKKTPTIKAGIYRPVDNYDTLRKMCLRRWFLNYNDNGLNKQLQDLIKNIVGPIGLNKKNELWN
ncbi:MAG TPA: hypothetical protein VJ881_08315 [Halanaerobiales bacterium]|nr:hypothetical protein [Halanaerobiales bacterium]